MTAKRTDKNQAEIMDALRKVGASVVDLHVVGKNLPDILIGYRGLMVLMEIKYLDGKLSPGQVRFIVEWKGTPILVVRSIEQALAWKDIIDKYMNNGLFVGVQLLKEINEDLMRAWERGE